MKAQCKNVDNFKTDIQRPARKLTDILHKTSMNARIKSFT